MYSLAEMSFMFRLSSVVIGMPPVSGRSHSNRRECARMTGVQKLKKIEGFPATNLTQQDAILPMAKSGFQKIAHGDAGHTVIGTPRFEANQVGVAQLNFGRIFDQKNALVFGDEPAEDVEITSFLDEDTVAAVHHHFADGVIEDEMFDGFQKTDSYTP